MSIEERPLDQLRSLINGYQVTQAIHVAATLGIADLVADGPLSVEDLASGVGIGRTFPVPAAAGACERRDLPRGRRAAVLLDASVRPAPGDASETLRGWATFIGRPPTWQAWGDLLHSVRTGENAFRHVHGGDVWEQRAHDPAEQAAFDRAMTDITRSVNRSLLDAYEFGRFSTIVDVGGGRGALLASLLETYPHLRGVLFDQPHVVEGAAAGLDPTSRPVSRPSAAASSTACPRPATRTC